METFQDHLVFFGKQRVPRSRTVEEERENFRLVQLAEDVGRGVLVDSRDVIHGLLSLVDSVKKMSMAGVGGVDHDAKETHGFIRGLERDGAAAEVVIREELSFVRVKSALRRVVDDAGLRRDVDVAFSRPVTNFLKNFIRNLDEGGELGT